MVYPCIFPFRNVCYLFSQPLPRIHATPLPKRGQFFSSAGCVLEVFFFLSSWQADRNFFLTTLRALKATARVLMDFSAPGGVNRFFFSHTPSSVPLLFLRGSHPRKIVFPPFGFRVDPIPPPGRSDFPLLPPLACLRSQPDHFPTRHFSPDPLPLRKRFVTSTKDGPYCFCTGCGFSNNRVSFLSLFLFF